MNSSTSSAAMRGATIVGTVLQLLMVFSGHWIEFIKNNVFAVGGMTISLLAGVLYARRARDPRNRSATNGLLVGGLCALIGISVSYALQDVEMNILGFGTMSSAIAGGIGAWLAGGERKV
ncbi:MAG: hypothetical protein V4550_08325 [Gemmatimonadota bacterium]